MISQKISNPNIFVTELMAFTQSSKLLAVFCNQEVAHRNFSGLSSIFTINDVVFGLFTT
jgi:hypothetical protein